LNFLKANRGSGRDVDQVSGRGKKKDQDDCGIEIHASSGDRGPRGRTSKEKNEKIRSKGPKGAGRRGQSCGRHPIIQASDLRNKKRIKRKREGGSQGGPSEDSATKIGYMTTIGRAEQKH